MSMSDPISDLITRIRNAQRNRQMTVECLGSNMAIRILDVLQDEGYIAGFRRVDVRPGVSKIIVDLKYYENQPSIHTIKRVSKPGCRVYSAINSMRKVSNGLGISVVSTSKGVMSDTKAHALKVGGEVLFQVF